MIKRLFNKMMKMQEQRAAYWVLMHMNDKQLKDIGVTRGELRQAVKGQ
jgi:uncharacterized protein YjiS (DUF1127 family)